MRAAFSHAFMSNAGPSEQHFSAKGTEQDAVRFSDSKYGSVDRFRKHPDFRKFKLQFSTAIQSVVDFSDQYALQVSPAISPRSLDAIKQNFMTFKAYLFVSDHFGAHLPLIYGPGKEYFDQFCSLLANHKIPLHTRLDAIIKLSKEITVCAGGIVTGLQHAIGALRASVSGIGESAKWRKTQLAESLALQFVRRNHKYPAGEEVHLVNAHLNYSAGILGIPTREDPSIGGSPVPTAQLVASQTAIRKELTPLRLATAMADDYLSQIREIAAAELEDVSVAIPEAMLSRVSAAIGVHQEATLDAQYGAVMFNDFVVEDTRGSNQYRIA